jgi:hypothetical protein
MPLQNLLLMVAVALTERLDLFLMVETAVS